jgi:hypothetical protein
LRMINDDTPPFWHSTGAPEHFSSSSTIQNLWRSNQSISLVDAKRKWKPKKKIYLFWWLLMPKHWREWNIPIRPCFVLI